ncbi:ABC transporter ATP-binding protein [Rhizobium tubonense]|uniref:Glycerol-3-phosphate ABC transporter ATP-binding protein n=1 Tax=Rhizobium tubonense TaxID=484088 RepID=A0A2W4CIU1_9HYPH|nr:ABC transporter ATP-binding protein [Rhizobium tubonense]PZM12957.1 glycerol-3-phosphate ABC transporter ATP-binding protein [Rhizobium tubonense]
MGSTLRIQDVSMSFGAISVLKQINLDIRAGSFVSLLGPSGCGKSTLLRVIAGFEAQQLGSILIDGRAVEDVPPRARNLAMVFQSYALYPHMTVSENISLPLEMELLSAVQRLPLVGRMAAGSKTVWTDIRRRVLDASCSVQIDHLLERRPSQLSGGQRQRVALARALVRSPGLFLMDEPLSNLDAKLRVAMRSELVSLNKQLESTILYVTHDQTEAMAMSDKIALMMGGSVLQYDAPEVLYTKPGHLDVATFIGQPAINCFTARIQNNTIVSDGVDCKLWTEYPNQESTLAIRPEALAITNKQPDGALISIPVTLDRVELLGSEILLWCSNKATGQSVVVQTRATFHRRLIDQGKLSGDLWLETDGAGTHVFDRNGKAVQFGDAELVTAVSKGGATQ